MLERPIPHRIIIPFLRRRRLLHLPRPFIYTPKKPKISLIISKPHHPPKEKPTRITPGRSILPLPPIPIIPHIPRPKNTIQQPPRNPVRPVFAISAATVEQGTREGPCIAPDLHDRPALVVGSDVVPEEGGAGGWVGADAVEEVGCVLVHAVVDHDCFVLEELVGAGIRDIWKGGK